ncbi:acyl-CoA carboxylase subunit epsilon [Streptomyces sp. NPDC054855]
MPSTELICVEKGSPTPEELAALTAVLLSRQAPDATPDDISCHHRATARWSRPDRTPRSPGPRSWRA